MPLFTVCLQLSHHRAVNQGTSPRPQVWSAQSPRPLRGGGGSDLLQPGPCPCSEPGVRAGGPTWCPAWSRGSSLAGASRTGEAPASWTPAARCPSGPAQHKGLREEGGSGHGGQGPFSHLSTTSPRREAAPFTSEKARREVGGPGGVRYRDPRRGRGGAARCPAGGRGHSWGGAAPPGVRARGGGASRSTRPEERGGPQAWRGLHLGLGSQELRDPGSPDARRPVLAAGWGTPAVREMHETPPSPGRRRPGVSGWPSPQQKVAQDTGSRPGVSLS